MKKVLSILCSLFILISSVFIVNVFATDPKVSIIIPVYNTPPNLLKDCLNSAKNQTLKEIEIICVDDGSTDGSGKILDEYAKSDTRFVVVHQENGGCAVARNKALDLARGEYVQFLDSDDTIDPNMSEKCYNKAKKCDADVIKCGWHNNCLKNRAFKSDMPDDLIYDVSSTFDYGFMHVIWNGIWKRKFLTDNNLRFDETQFARTDASFSMTCGLYANKIVGIAEKLYNYKQYSKPNSICGVCEKNGDIDYRCGMYRFIFKHIKAIDNDVVTKCFVKWFLKFAVKHADKLAVQKITSEILQNISINEFDATEKIIMWRANPQSSANKKPIEDGIYTISSKLDPNVCLDINHGSKDDKANLQLWQRNETNAQKFKVQYNSDGYYTIKAMCSGKFIAVSDAGNENEYWANIWQYGGNGTDAQKWFIVPDGEGYCVFFSKCNDLCMDVNEAKAINYANIHCLSFQCVDSQRFKLEKCEDKPNRTRKPAGKPRPNKPVKIKKNAGKPGDSEKSA